ncbi:MAG: AAA family ATPase [Deltaproteobacteria bacterium]|nr:AAA family ATPase [Deltaproteobacteria bacterium]
MSIRNVRCFGPEQAMTLTTSEGLPARWTVVLGENGVGKTTLLQMLALLSVDDSGEVEHMLEYEMFELFEYRWERRRPPRPGQLSESLRRSGEGGTVTATFRKDKAEFRHSISAGLRDQIRRGHPIKYPPFLCGYGANRRLGEGGLRKRSREPRLPFLSLFGDVELRDAEEWLLQADYAAKREPSARTELKRAIVEELLVQVLPDVNKVRIGNMKDDYPSVEAETPYGWVSVRNLSLGYQTLIAWMVDLASRFLERFGESKNPLGEPAIVLVDEIDLHLHPKWQRSLMSYLGERFPATQFIATAHSPLVVQGATGANIVVIRRDGDHVRMENSPEEIQNWRIDQILTSDLYGLPSARPPHLDALLEERRSILTKAKISPSDKKRLRALESEIGSLPGGESPDELRAMELIERAARQLDKPRKRPRR